MIMCYYNYGKYFDPNILINQKVMKHQLIESTDFPLPSEVEISESGTCNRSCSFCSEVIPRRLKNLFLTFT